MVSFFLVLVQSFFCVEHWTGKNRPDYTLVPRVQWVHLTVPSSVGTEITNIHRWGAGLRSPYLTKVIMWTT